MMTGSATISVSPQQEIQAEQLKTEANLLFSQKKYSDAIKKYTDAISFNPTVPAFYSNRAFGNSPAPVKN